MSAWFYILRLQSGSLYPGATADLKQRYKEHSTKRACRTTALDPPIAVVYSEEYETLSEARRREAQVKTENYNQNHPQLKHLPPFLMHICKPGFQKPLRYLSLLLET